jgi:hypothetical protein
LCTTADDEKLAIHFIGLIGVPALEAGPYLISMMGNCIIAERDPMLCMDRAAANAMAVFAEGERAPHTLIRPACSEGRMEKSN